MHEIRKDKFSNLDCWYPRMEFGLACDGRESPNICTGSLSVTNPEEVHGCMSQITCTQHTEDWKQQALALLCFGNSPFTLITSTSKNQANGRIQGRTLPCFASCLHRHTATWRAWQGALKPQHIVGAACLSSASSRYAINCKHRSRLNEFLSRMSTLLPSWMLPKSYQEIPIFCAPGNGPMQHGELKARDILWNTSASQKYFKAWPGFDWHQSPKAQRAIFICVYHTFCAT